MAQFRLNGTIKSIMFKDARVSVLLTSTTFLSKEGDWKQWVDWKLVEGGKYKKGDVWVSAFEQSAPEVYQACKMIEKGSEVEVDIFKTEKGFLNINNIQLKVPDKDVNEDLEPPEPSSKQRPKDSPEAEAEEMSTALDNVEASREVLIIRQTCIKAAGSAMSGKLIDMAIRENTELFVALAKRLEKYVLSGK